MRATVFQSLRTEEWTLSLTSSDGAVRHELLRRLAGHPITGPREARKVAQAFCDRLVAHPKVKVVTR